MTTTTEQTIDNNLTLNKHEEIILCDSINGKDDIKAVGCALYEIQQQRLFKEAAYLTFESYCNNRLGKSVSWATRLISAYRTIVAIEAYMVTDHGCLASTSIAGSCVKILWPETEAQYRLLNGLSIEQKVLVLDIAKDTVSNYKSITKAITHAKRQVLGLTGENIASPTQDVLDSVADTAITDVIEDVSSKPEPKKKRAVGLDFGVNTFITLSDGTKIENTKASKEYTDNFILAVDTPAEAIDKKEENVSLVVDKNNPVLFNPVTKDYVVYSKSIGRNITIKESTHKAMMKAWSDALTGSKMTAEEMSHNFNIPVDVFNDYKNAFGWDHGMLPVSEEDMASKDDEHIIKGLVEDRAFALTQKYNKEEWKAVQDEADKWRRLKARSYDPLQDILNNYQPKVLPELYLNNPIAKVDYSNDVLVVGLSDLHFGLKCDESTVLGAGAYNKVVAVARLKKYMDQLVSRLITFKYKKVIILGLGDLLHGIEGTTIKGTKLECDMIGEEQFDTTMDALIAFIATLYKYTKSVEVHSVRGNHDGVNNYFLLQAVSKFFVGYDHISFTNNKAKMAFVRSGNVMIIMDHGNSADNKARTPTTELGMENYVNTIISQNHHLMHGVTQKIFVQGDLHHWENVEKKGFEYFIFPSLVGSDDKYSNDMGFYSRPSQRCLVLDENNVKEILNFYLK